MANMRVEVRRYWMHGGGLVPSSYYHHIYLCFAGWAGQMARRGHLFWNDKDKAMAAGRALAEAAGGCRVVYRKRG